METSRQATCLAESTNVDLCGERSCGAEQKGAAPQWRELGHLWGDEKQGRQDVAGTLSGCFERQHSLFDDCLDKPSASKVDAEEEEGGGWAPARGEVNGEELGDVPASYVLEGFRPHELAVLGTYVDKNIVPGFKYRVRKNLNEDYLFDGKSLTLLSVGQGYGKRLTFEGPYLNKNDNFFWSDSRDGGYAFSLQAINKGDIFYLVDTESSFGIGRLVVRCCRGEQVEMSSSMQKESGVIQKKIRVQFSCDIVLNDCSNKQNLFLPNVFASGVAVVIKERFSPKAVLDKIELDDFFLKNCKLIPEE